MAARSRTAQGTGRPEDERLSVPATFAYGFQHVLTLYGGMIAPPLIIGAAAGVDPSHMALLVASAIFMGGLGTILQSRGVPFFGSQLPLVQGVSFTGVATMLAILQGGGGLPAVFGAVLVASALALIITPFFAQVLRFFPPVVTGVVILAIGLSLMPVGADWAMGGAAAAGTDSYGSIANLTLAGGTLLVVILLSKLGIAALSRLSILLAIVIGTTVAAFLGMADLGGLFGGQVVELPTPLAFGAPTFAVGAIVSLFIVNLVNMTEATADMLAVGEIIGTKVGRRRIADGLRADMLTSTVSPLFNSFTQSSFSQNVGLVAITGVRSRFVVAAGGLILVVLGFFPSMGYLVAAIPPSVLGGAGFVLFGSVAVAGIRILSKVRYEGNMNLVVIAASLGFGLAPVVMPDIYGAFPDWFRVIFGSGIVSSALMAVLLNILFNHLKFGTPKDGSVFAASRPRLVGEGQLAPFVEGDTITGGGIVDSEGNEVPMVSDERLAEVQTKLESGEISSYEELLRACEES